MEIQAVQMVALRQMYYDRDLGEGEPFEATPEHAALLARVGSARVVEESPKSAPKKYERRDMRAKE
jgi:hypothetical protein